MASGAKVVIENGATFDQLVDVLLSQPLSKNDTKFITIFLTLYRNFACPRQLLEGIVTRFQQASGCAGAAAASAAGGGAAGGGSTSATTSPLSDTICRLRYLAILEQWIKQYPGDFAYHLTYRRTKQFVADLSGDRICLVAVREITAHLAIVSEDDDTYWACNDQDWLTRQASLADDSDSASSGDIARAFDDMGISDGGAAAAAAAASQGGVAATGRSRNSVVTSPHSDASQTALGMAEERERELKLLSVDPKVHCTKTQWRQIMAQTADAIALELTRIDWVMFSAIRPRDLVRHVTLTAEQRKCCKGLGNVDRIIDHFNHLAYWVINLVLLRDKPKHRALILEKFMKVARKLRELNNYSSLGAIVAGINGSSVHRLVATRELVTPAAAKNFMKLEILMGTQRSHFAYRLAWDNTVTERIPYLPLHRRDLAVAAEGNKTFANSDTGCVNWKKFDILGDVMVGIQRALATPYPPIIANEEIRSLVLEVKLSKDEDILYDRSAALEPSGPSERRKFSWFQSR